MHVFLANVWSIDFKLDFQLLFAKCLQASSKEIKLQNYGLFQFSLSEFQKGGIWSNAGKDSYKNLCFCRSLSREHDKRVRGKRRFRRIVWCPSQEARDIKDRNKILPPKYGLRIWFALIWNSNSMWSSLHTVSWFCQSPVPSPIFYKYLIFPTKFVWLNLAGCASTVTISALRVQLFLRSSLSWRAILNFCECVWTSIYGSFRELFARLWSTDNTLFFSDHSSWKAFSYWLTHWV